MEEYSRLGVCGADLLNLNSPNYDILEEERSYRAETSTNPTLWNKMLEKGFPKWLHGDTHSAHYKM